MIDEHPDSIRFKEHMRDSLFREGAGYTTGEIPRHGNVYSCGDEAAAVYFVESGHIKLVVGARSVNQRARVMGTT